jgi:hypothetical protein
MIVASFGPRVHERFDLAASKQTSIDHLRRAVDDANEQLRNGYPLAKVLFCF